MKPKYVLSERISLLSFLL